jgi:hypothetical protein
MNRSNQKTMEYHEPETFDAAGNRIVIQQYNDGRRKKITSPKYTSTDFEFQGKEYNLPLLQLNERVKTYYEDSDSEARLERDTYGRLWVFFYDEYRLSNGDDRYDYLWKLVPDEAFADEFVGVYRLSRLREPYISYDGCGWMAAHEFIENEML